MANKELNTTDINATEALNMIDGLDMDLDTTVQTLLIPVYENFPVLANTFFDIPLANLIAAILVFLFPPLKTPSLYGHVQVWEQCERGDAAVRSAAAAERHR